MTDEKSENNVVNLALVGNAIAGAEIAPVKSDSKNLIPETYDERRSLTPNSNRDFLPPDCPVTPLGKTGDLFHYLDQNGQLRTLKARDHSQNGIDDIFGAQNYLLDHFWPRSSQHGDIIGCDYKGARRALMGACAQEGLWNPLDKVRGAGSWRSDDGELILHCGDAIISDNKISSPGKIGRFVYPACEPLPRPASNDFSQTIIDPGEWLLGLLRTWNWRRPEIDARLLLGWIGAAMIGGALDWRPAVWITGGQGTGKSTLHHVLKNIFGDALFSLSDATSAGIWQKLGHASLPVAVDELEADTDNSKSEGIIKLARQAASGGIILRGGQNHSSSEFTARSCFLFSSIIVPPLDPQDLSRLAVLELKKLSVGAIMKLDKKESLQFGSLLKRRMVNGWQRWTETLECYRKALIEQGHDARGADQFGTLLAASDILMSDTLSDPISVQKIAALLRAEDIAKWSDEISDERAMLQKLLTSTVDISRSGSRLTVAEWIEDAIGLISSSDINEGNRILSRIGLKVHIDSGKQFLAMANLNSELARLFEGTKWCGRGGRGLWKQSALRLEGAVLSPNPIRFGGVTGRCVLIPMETVTGEKTIMPPMEDSSELGIDDEIPF